MAMSPSAEPSLCPGLQSAFACAASPLRQAQSVEQFYKGRTVTMLVGTAPGGINDISARLVARHLGRFIPGNPTIIVQNNPGAGGLVTANRLYNVAEKDGSVLAKLERAVPQLAIQGDSQCQLRSAEIHLARQPVVLCRRRLSDAGQRQPSGPDRRRSQAARRLGDARRRQCRRRAI